MASSSQERPLGITNCEASWVRLVEGLPNIVGFRFYVSDFYDATDSIARGVPTDGRWEWYVLPPDLARHVAQQLIDAADDVDRMNAGS